MPIHYRILRDRAHRDDDAMIAPIVVAGGTWPCSVCGEENEDDDVFCGWCSTRNGDWVCPCGRKNRKGDDECSDCGLERPEE